MTLTRLALLGLVATIVAAAGIAVAHDDLDGTIWPRDIFAVLIHDKKPPIRGWKLEFARTGIVYSGSVDHEEYIITATKGKDALYYHVSIDSGVERETEQSLYEVRVKEVQTPDEDWRHNFWWDRGEWSGERGKSSHWVPSEHGYGICSNGEMSWSATKEACFKERQFQKVQELP